MVDLNWVGSFIAGAICLGAGLLAAVKDPRALASKLFLLAMAAIFATMVTGATYPLMDEEQADQGNIVAKAFVISALLGFTLLWETTIVFPHRRRVSFRPMNYHGRRMLIAVVAVIVVGAFAEVDYSADDRPIMTDLTALMMLAVAATMVSLATGFVLLSRPKVGDLGRRSGTIFLLGLWMFVLSGIIWLLDQMDVLPFSREATSVGMTWGVAASGLIFGYSIAMGRMTIGAPVTETLASSSKSSYRLFHRYVYLVEEQKPDFAFKLFADVLKGRCWDCEDDESFSCESIDCSQCKLPCPCRECTKYRSRSQGLVVTRQYPNDVRAKYFLQTTPIIWLSTVPGKDIMDPAKLSLLTDMLTGFMEKSHNGVVLIDGIEYLVTTNDFAKTVKAIDKWTETAMTSSSRLILTVDPRSFDRKELALLERNKEVVRPDSPDKWRIIPEPM